MMHSTQELVSRQYARLVHLIEIAPLGLGHTIYLSDRQVQSNGVQYDNLISAISFNEQGHAVICFTNILMGASGRLSDLFLDYPVAGSQCSISECYLDMDGTPSAQASVIKGVLGGPAAVTKTGFSCMLYRPDYVASIRAGGLII